MDLNQLYDMQTIEVMKRVLAHDSNAIDIGCHRGSMLTEILNIAPDGRHFAFEPLPDMFAHLKADFGANLHVSLHNLALSENSGSVTFQHVVTNPGYSGLRKRRYDRDNEQIVEIKVRTERLDDIILRDIDIRFIKIDVEGAELGFCAVQSILSAAVSPLLFLSMDSGRRTVMARHLRMFLIFWCDCGLHCFTMELWLANAGKNRLERADFCDEFRSGRNYYFLAA